MSGFIGACAFAVGSGYIPALTCGWKYWPWIKGRVSGAVLTAFGFGAFIFSLVGTYIVNPENAKPLIVEQYSETVTYKYFTAEIANRVPGMYQQFFLIYLGMTIVAGLLINHPEPADLVEIERRHEEIKEQKKQALD
jgi:hypothetical protein